MSLLEEIAEAAARRPGEARALPFAAYSDPQVFDLERERIFHRDWVGVCAAAAKLAERLRQAIISAQADAKIPFQIKAGYDAVPNVGQTPAEAGELLPHASAALRNAMAAGSGEWILPFDRGTKH